MTMPKVVLDASAMLAVLNGERGADGVMAEIDDAIVSMVNYAEVASKLIEKGRNREAAKEAICGLGVQLVDFDQELADRTGELRPLTRHRGLSLGDRACIALAERDGAAVLTADHRWRDVVPTVEVRLFR
jgi:PIN domain nuclease of toxin-antitoxin system